MILSRLPQKTLGGAQLWADVRYREGFRIQRHVLTGHHRLLDPGDRREGRGSLAECERALAERAPRAPEEPRDRVLLLHGLGRTRRSLAPVAERLRREGYEAIAVDYPSTRRSIEAHAAQVTELLDHLPGQGRLAIVTHSLGGIVARLVLAGEGRFRERHVPSRLLMLAPPSRGAVVARRLRRRAAFRLVLGPSGQDVADLEAVPAPTIPFAIVAGSLRGGRGANPLIDGDDDGVVSVEETRLVGAVDHLVVPAVHTFVMREPVVIDAVVRFLRDGRLRDLEAP